MSAKTKIVVLRMKELIYTGIFVGLAILLIVIFLAMFRGGDPDKNREKPDGQSSDPNTAVDTNADVPTIRYIPGVYTASLPLSSQSLDVEVIVDADRITSIRLLNLEESVAAMYPLMGPTMDSLRTQILTTQSTDGITYEDSSKYTAYVLLQTVQSALQKATLETP